ncbi:MAG: hypothetical protein KDA77_17265, partial [Planctomycetaceae bacterium]|nr:hypothetical protein [Planctomycetaceae bacterium]
MPQNFPSELELFESQLKHFVPPHSFDAHAHLYQHDPAITGFPEAAENEQGDSGWREYCHNLELWMGDRRPSAGLFFAIPKRNLKRP